MRVVRVITITILWLVAALPLEAATLTWDRNPEPDVLGYRVCYSTQPGVHSTEVDVGNVLTFSLAPPAGQSYYIVVRAYNTSGASPDSNEVVVSSAAPTNLPPTLNQPPNQSGLVGSSATLALTASDPENATLTFTATGLPAGLSVSSATRTIAGTLQTAGTYTVTVTVSDGSLTASRTFTWIVSPPSSTTPPPPPADTTPPTVSFTSPVNNDTINGKNVKLRVNATDPGGIRSVRYSLNGVALSGEITVAPYLHTWELGAVANGSYQLSARALDNAGNAATTTISVTVKTGGNGKNTVASTTEAVAAGADAASQNGRADLDTPVSGDFDGDGLADPGSFTASTGEWRLFLSSAGYAPSAPLVWGGEHDVPVPADYDGDGRADLAVYRPSSGTWSIVMSNRGNPSRLDVAWGRDDDRPMTFDYDQDGKADLALGRTGGFDILLSSKGYSVSVAVR